MADTDVNAALLATLKNKWPSIGGLSYDQFDTSKVKLKLLTIEYPDLQSKLVKQPTVIGHVTIDNTSGATITRDFTYSHTSTDTYEWHVTGGVKVTAGASATVTLPLVGEGEANTSVELNVEGGSATTTEETETWESSESITVPPNASVDAQAVLSMGRVTGTPFKAHMYAYGQVGVHVQYGTNAWEWEWADLDTGGWTGAANNPVKKLPLDPQDREFVIEGTFDGSVGLIVVVTAKPVTALAAAPA